MGDRRRTPIADAAGDVGVPAKARHVLLIDDDDVSRDVGAPAMDRHVLLIDDDGDIREILVQILTDRGYRVSEAVNGSDGLARLRSAHEPRPCLILLDMMMPVMDGWRFRQEQLADAQLASIPVVILTAASVAGQMPLLRVSEILQKPIHLGDLCRAVARHCPPTP